MAVDNVATHRWKWLHPKSPADLKREANAADRVWLYQDFIAKGSVNLIAAYAKVGKSTFLYPLLVAISQGKPFMGIPTTQTPVLILSEEPDDVVQERLETLGMVEDDPNFQVHTDIKNMDDDAFADAEFWLSETHGLVVVDTISGYMGIEDDNDNAEIAKKLLPLIRLIRKHKGTVAYVHHDRKLGADSDEGKMIRGAGEYLAAVDQVFMLGRDGGVDSPRRVIRSLGRYRTVPRKIVVEYDGRADFTLISRDDNRGMTPSEEKLWKVLPVLPVAMTAEEAAALAGMDDKTARDFLSKWGDRKPPLAIASGKGVRGDPRRWSRIHG